MAMHPRLLNVPSSLAADVAPVTAREALSGIFGTISLVSWIVLLVPQILESYKNQSGDGISMAFLLIWLLGDLANLAGSVMANLLSTVITLAVYFCVADFVLISQTMYYKHVNGRKSSARETRRQSRESNNPTQPLLSRRRSSGANRAHSSTPHSSTPHSTDRSSPVVVKKQRDFMATATRNCLSLLGVVFAGCLGWFLAWKSGAWSVTVDGEKKEMPWIGIFLGYASAVLYLGARIPQILKNYNNKSCDGLSILFFLLSLMGNITYGAGILFHSTNKYYVLQNLPWLIGSLGTMAQDFIIFGQFHYYSNGGDKEVENNSAIV